MPSEKAYHAVRETVRWTLKALAAVGVPGASLAEDAVEQAAAYLDDRRAWDALQKALAEAEADFRQTAREQGWHDLADALLQLPEHNREVFQAALQAALTQKDPAPLEAHLRESLAALPGVDDPDLAAQAARLYAVRVLYAVWRIEPFHDAVQDVLFRQQDAALARLEARVADLDALLRTLPEATARRVLALQEARARAKAWNALTPPEAPAAPAPPGTPFQFYELKAAYCFVPFKGRKHHTLRDNLVQWAQSLDARPGRTGLRWLYGPGGAGKTRLLVEVARTLQEAGWQVGFLSARGVGRRGHGSLGPARLPRPAGGRLRRDAPP